MAEMMTRTAADAQVAAAEGGSAPSGEHDLEACAEQVLQLLPPHIADQIRENALVFNKIPLAYTIAGLVLRTHESGESNSPILDPAWPRRFHLSDPIEGAIYKCEGCGVQFKPRRFKQRACSQECGKVLAERDQLNPPPRPRRTYGVRV